MKAMIFAAGLGTRLRPITDTMPKALVPVAGIPMLERVILHLKAFGFNKIVINIHHFGQQILDFLKANENFGVTIMISDERGELLDTGGGILKARQFLDGNEPFLVHNVDILTDLDLKSLYDYHMSQQADATLLTAERTTSRYLLLDDKSRVCGWTNVKTGEVKPTELPNPNLYKKEAFGGIHVISPSVFPSLATFSSEHKFSIIPYYLSVCLSLKIISYDTAYAYHWFDIGKPETLAKADAWLQENKK